MPTFVMSSGTNQVGGLKHCIPNTTAVWLTWEA